MSSSVNKVILIGNLGKDPEVRYLNTGVALATFPLATSETIKDKTNGQKREITEWHNIVLWRGLAEVGEKYLKKGMKIYIEGKIKTRSWKDEKDVQRYITEIVADGMTMLSSSTAAKSNTNDYPSSIEKNDLPPLSSEISSDVSGDVPF